MTQLPTQTSPTPVRSGPPVPATRPARSRRLVLVLAMAMVLGALAALLLGPRTPSLGTAAAGDAALVADVRAAMTSDRGYQSLSVARVRDGQVTFAALGSTDGRVPTPQTPFEMGSITKTVTGSLLAIAVERGEMRLEEPVSTYLPELAGTPAGGATLAELATHSAGLPPLPPSLGLRMALSGAANENPYGGVSTGELLATTRSVAIEDPGTYQYSNLGMALLGHAEARAAGAPDWPTLARERVWAPLGMTSTFVAVTEQDRPASAAPPRRDNGWRAAFWYGAAFAPAGTSTWTTAEDLARYAQAQLDGGAPGAAALDPRAPAESRQIGLAWQVQEREGKVITWHNGGTGGFRTMLAIDREGQQAVVVLGNSTRWTTPLGLELAGTGTGDAVQAVDEPRSPGFGTLVAAAVGLLMLVSFALGLLRGKDRLSVGGAVLYGLGGLLILLAQGPWMLVPAWIWGALTAASVAGLVLALPRIRALPALPPRRRALAVGSLLPALVFVAAVVIAL